MYPQLIQKLIERLSKFPTVGPRTATRFVFYLLKLSPNELEELVNDIRALNQIKLCKLCYMPNESEVCLICSNPAREAVLCIVEKESDVETIEKTKTHKGYYFILGGTVGSLKQEDVERIRAPQLKKRVQDAQFKEVIIATNPTTEGEATALYLERLFKPLQISVTRLGRGLPIGAELEYTDEETLRSAFESRR
ncbi:recombination protein RecR [Patescibacteria group bacterium]|nr:recombination protein RecR [Patescibacteria group bacterium]